MAAAHQRKTRRISRRGGVVIPAELRHRLGLEAGQAVVAEQCGNGVLIRPAGAAAGAADVLEILRQGNADYAQLRQDAAGWSAWCAEQAVLEGTLLDGLEAEEA